MLTKSQFSLVGAYTRVCSATSRFVIQQNIIVIYHLILMAVLYFHLLNICGFTSSVSCMSNEIVESMMKTNQTHRDAKLTRSDLNMTDFFETNADIYVFRIVAPHPDELLSGRAKTSTGSRMSHRSVYLSEYGDVMQYQGNTADMAEHD